MSTNISEGLPAKKKAAPVVDAPKRELITIGKKPTLANKRLAFSRLRDRDNVVKLFSELGPRFENRPGGYTRIYKNGFRPGDNAPMALMEFVEKGSIQGIEESNS